QTTTPNGQPLISAEEIEQGIIDVLNDDNDLSIVQSIFAKYQEYQTAVTEFNNNLAMQQRQTEINNATQMTEVPNDLIANIIAQAGGQGGSNNTMDNTSANTNNTSVNGDRKSTRLNSSHVSISYAVFCLKKKKINTYKSLYTINST